VKTNQSKTVNKTEAGKVSLTELPEFKTLEEHYSNVKNLHMRRMFSTDSRRFNKLSLEHRGLLLDFSKNRITYDTIPLLCELARAVDLEGWRERMFTGEKINNTENRAVLHTALRNRTNTPVFIDGKDVMPKVNASLDKMQAFSEKIRQGDWKGYTGKVITDVINIGIGGSDLGPKMVCEALKNHRHERITLHFVSSVNGEEMDEVLDEINPETSLFIVASKSFATQETLTNAKSARKWFLQSAKHEEHVSKHFVAISSNKAAVSQFGIDTANMFELWSWVGGRYSVWSAIGLSVVISVGMKNFKHFLAGAHSMDKHFREAPLEKNMPVILGLLGIWYNNFFKVETHGIFPYGYSLRSLPIYLEQADMESNGKSVDRDGRKVDYPTGSILWGMLGINGQHAFYQAIHQGTKMVPADFIVSMQSNRLDPVKHQIMFSNALAQTEALMRGRNYDETYADIMESNQEISDIDERIHQMIFEGNHPTNTILIDKLTPRTLGMLIALYEHKIFVQGIIWNLNSFDQWGVELGKQLARNIFRDIDQPFPATSHDSSTNTLINYYRDYMADKDDIANKDNKADKNNKE